MPVNEEPAKAPESMGESSIPYQESAQGLERMRASDALHALRGKIGDMNTLSEVLTRTILDKAPEEPIKGILSAMQAYTHEIMGLYSETREHCIKLIELNGEDKDVS